MRILSNYIRERGLLIVVSGPSGVGKDAVLTEFEKIYSNACWCVTTTTRQPRVGEVDGVSYNFISVEDFHRQIEQNAFLEYAEVHGNLYGTPRKWVEEKTTAGCDVILKIDVQGGLNVKQQMPSSILVFLVPPSIEELERRLRSRSTETEAQIEKRSSDARHELEQIPHYNYIIENDSLQKAAEELKAVIIAEHCRIQQQE